MSGRNMKHIRSIKIWWIYHFIETFCLLTGFSFLDLYLLDGVTGPPLEVIGFVDLVWLFFIFEFVVFLFYCLEKLGYFV